MSVRWGRLRNIRNFIASLPDNACDMGHWQYIVYNENTDRQFTFKEMKKNGFECGSAACIGGWTEMYVNHLHKEEHALLSLKVRGVPKYIEADEYLGLNARQRELLFFDFPNDLPEDYTWKTWMVERLDIILKEKEIRSFELQMPVHVRESKRMEEEEFEVEEV